MGVFIIMSIIKEEYNTKYWIIGIVLLLVVGIYLVGTNIDFSKLHKEEQINTYTQMEGNVSNPALDNINKFFMENNFGSVGMLMISIFAFSLALIWMLRGFSKNRFGNEEYEY
jgi:low temperature requirement protein LtrA